MKAEDSVIDWERQETGPLYDRRPHASRQRRGKGETWPGGEETEKGMGNTGIHSQ